jgi:hypothetical protein
MAEATIMGEPWRLSLRTYELLLFQQFNFVPLI